MKPAVILFTTISFVMILTILIMKMVHNNEEILVVNEKEYRDANALLVIDDLKNSIGKQLLENRSMIDEFVSSISGSSIKYKNIVVDLSLEKFDRPYNLNNILQNENLNDIKKFFIENEIDFEEFNFFIQEYFSSYDLQKISLVNNKQVKDILLSFLEDTQNRDKNILLYSFTYFDIEKSDQYYRCDLSIFIDEYKYKSSFLYNLNTLEKNNIKVRNFEITIAS